MASQALSGAAPGGDGSGMHGADSGAAAAPVLVGNVGQVSGRGHRPMHACMHVCARVLQKANPARRHDRGRAAARRQTLQRGRWEGACIARCLHNSRVPLPSLCHLGAGVRAKHAYHDGPALRYPGHPDARRPAGAPAALQPRMLVCQ